MLPGETELALIVTSGVMVIERVIEWLRTPLVPVTVIV